MVDPMTIVATEARAHRTVVIHAREKDGTRETREIEPYSLRRGKNGRLLFFWCLKRDAIRSLRVRSITRAEATGRNFEPRYPVEL